MAKKTIIKHFRSSTPGNVPGVGDVELGEFAINDFDGRVFFKKDDGVETIVELAAIGGNGSGVHDRQIDYDTTQITTTSTTYVPIADWTVTAGDFNGSTAEYLIHITVHCTHATADEFIVMRLLKNGTPVVGMGEDLRISIPEANEFIDATFTIYIPGIVAGDVFTLEWHQTKSSGQKTATIEDRLLVLDGIPQGSLL